MKTKIRTSQVTNTQLAVAVLAAFMAGGVAFAAAPPQQVRAPKCGVNSSAVVQTIQGCARGQYSGINFICHDGTRVQHRSGVCMNANDLRAVAQTACANRCSTPPAVPPQVDPESERIKQVARNCNEGEISGILKIDRQLNNINENFQLSFEATDGEDLTQRTVWLQIYDIQNNQTNAIRLYNDGTHNDGQPQDTIHADTWKSSRIGNFLLKPVVIDKSGECILDSAKIPVEVANVSCNDVIPGHNNANADRINLVFFGINYPNQEILQSDIEYLLAYDGKPSPVRRYCGENGNRECRVTDIDFGLFAIEPYRSSKNKFNIWKFSRIIETEDVYEVHKLIGFNYDESLQLPYCENRGKIFPIYLSYGDRANNITNGGSLTVRELINRETIHFGFTTLRLPVHQDTLGIGFANVINFVHEFSHSIGGLPDEYEGDGQVPLATYPSCATSREEAEEWWGDLVGQVDPFFDEYISVLNQHGLFHELQPEDVQVGFHEGGCLLSYGNPQMIRPTRYSLMSHDLNNIGHLPVLGSVNRRRVQQVMDLFSGQ